MKRKLDKQEHLKLVQRCLSDSGNNKELSKIEQDMIRIAFGFGLDYFVTFSKILSYRSKIKNHE